ncbi:Histone-lysine N-methyltransferase ASHH1 [Vitis vinifera]|uniref:Histone-lysine N-methyltransferase ASHH1 n=1 Tax=Vitis vinifera TaxID=29760 RepID=A0A438D508_VITVI|nr:Histone-lysine N-methyltransferase ASHH1 [Vitis vinifera]
MLANFPIKAHLTQNPSVSVSLIYSSMFVSEASNSLRSLQHSQSFVHLWKTKFQWYEWSQKNECEYAKTLLLWIEGHGWGLLANENIKVGEFVMEHSGEVITWTQERGSSLVFVSQGIKNSCIISLNAK